MELKNPKWVLGDLLFGNIIEYFENTLFISSQFFFLAMYLLFILILIRKKKKGYKEYGFMIILGLSCILTTIIGITETKRLRGL